MLLHKLPIVMEKFEENLLQEQYNLTFSQFRVLLAIGKEEVCQSEVATFWSVTDAAISRQIEPLVQDGLIERTPDPGSRRKNKLKLTPNGLRKLKLARDYIDEQYEALYDVLSKEERFQLAKQLQKLLGVLCPGKQDKTEEACEV